MSLAELFLNLLSVFGLTFIFVHAKIMDKLKIRPLLNKWEFTKELQHCALCSGTWIATFFVLLNPSFEIKFIFAAAGFSFILERFVILMDDYIIKINTKND